MQWKSGTYWKSSLIAVWNDLEKPVESLIKWAYMTPDALISFLTTLSVKLRLLHTGKIRARDLVEGGVE